MLPVDGADLFGGPEARAADYPVTARPARSASTAYDASEIRTLISLGDSCPDRGVAYAALTLGHGWDWVFGGGTAEYTAVYPNPVPPGFVGNGFNIVDAVRTGNEGAVAELVSGADITVDDFECPVVDELHRQRRRRLQHRSRRPAAAARHVRRRRRDPRRQPPLRPRDAGLPRDAPAVRRRRDPDDRRRCGPRGRARAGLRRRQRPDVRLRRLQRGPRLARGRCRPAWRALAPRRERDRGRLTCP